MDKRFIYIGLLFPFYGLGSEAETHEPHEELTHVDHAKAIDETAADDGSDNHDDDEVDDEALEDNEIDLTTAPEHARGNWYEKQQILKQAHDVYQDLRQKEAEVATFEAAFVAKKNELTNIYEQFTGSLTRTVAVIYQEVVDQLKKLEEAAKPVGQLTQQERVKLAESQETKLIMTQLKKDLDTVTELYKAADQAMATLMQQITMAHTLEHKAFEAYKKIAQVLSDQVARELYAEIVAARESIHGAADYIQGAFTRYFDELRENISKSITLVHQQIATLKERGIDLTNAHEEKVEEKKPAAAQAPQPQGYIKSVSTWFLTALSTLWQTVVHAITRIFSWVTGFFV